MKNIWLIAFLFNCSLFLLSAENVFLDRTKLEFYSNWSKELTLGTKLYLPFTEVRFYEKPKDKSITYSLNLNTSSLTKNFPLTIKAGKLGLSGSYARINSPALSSVISPYFSVSKEASILTVQLPSASNYSKNDSLFLQTEFIKINNVIQKLTVNGFLQSEPGKEKVLFYGGGSGLIKIKTGNTTTLSLSGTIYYSPYASPDFSSWFNENKYYKDGNHLCGVFQTGLSSKHFSSLFSVNLYESPFKEIDSIYRYEQSLKFGKNAFNAAIYYNQKDNLLTVNKTTDSSLQIKTGIKKSFSAMWHKPVFFSTGITGFYQDFFLENQQKIKFSAGGKLTTDISNLSLTINAEGLFLQNTTYLKFSLSSFSSTLSYSVFLNFIKPLANVSFVAEPLSSGNWKTSEKLKLSVLFPKNPRINIYSTASFIQKMQENKTSLSVGLSYVQYTRFLNLNLNCNFEF